ncbi:M14 family metallopeptidase [Christiangramia sp. SM2212]|uniref:M14 family metallopeptidase n=1 Tax=Christiangramia sediminicola TaxID=3073267 RepID=A0ABU1ERN1_9FLAO|nr:M14 family metallopeptidase [Christiangramia sp. SM2212]MDR5591048.1 M14 family metallopeptidase [Christiangramia sp. SM2212]
MKKLWLALGIVISLSSCDFSKYKLVKDYDFETRFEKTDGTETGTYAEVIEFYKKLAEAYPSISLQEFGETDSGLPLHLAIYNPSGEFDLEKLRKSHSVMLINNGIHPGESDGIDATMMMFRDMAGDSIASPKNTVIATIPIYNVGGTLNRNSGSRTNQNGPKEYGFRGNARNYDLNRDFIKSDTKNAQTFYEIFHYLDPDVFIDNHVSNGADYQYTLTHLFTQHDKLGGNLGDYVQKKMMPALEDSLKAKDWDITPYVNVFNEVPENGFSQFMDSPRYSTGYTSLWNTLGMMVETHMLKPYEKRVWGTYELMRSMIKITDAESSVIKDLRNQARRKYLTDRKYNLRFEIDKENPSKREFKGFEAENIASEVTGQERLKYDRDKTFTKEIEYFDNFKVTEEIEIPRAYIIPQGWWTVVDRLKMNDIKMETLDRDTIINVEVYKIEDYETSETAYEGHYPHKNTKVSTSSEDVRFQKGDYMITTFQDGARYLIETLEPSAVDSFFNWNFFDTVLQQKEGFSPYVFEDIAKDMLDKDPELKEEFENKKSSDAEFRNNWYTQLDWIHKRSSNYEDAHLRYPVFRLPR